MIRIVNDSDIIETEFFIEKFEKIADDLEMDGDITIKLSDRDESRKLNLKYRKKDYPTDVLSFPINEQFPDSYYIGDILVCYPLAEEQAEENNISVKKELFTLICHGLLHLAGYDHETDSGDMLNLQDQIINRYYHE
ncbi:MAG: rRNA maturation RNase YbeY [Candidatus Aminicenantes bacterium]|nr:rRNA maturation RNase YbeY [Candidatus Aminicenantes bacterium]